ncbi:uncharacterized protein LOC132285920 [Cornus florida]|uniref:uncharacterized protein LOC132285920 n=1 Tax=Cornus florida TaxID=4283 RepID=UPI0028985DCB|nr:uncharacterized protein LOC132285920 [Cornus florida]
MKSIRIHAVFESPSLPNSMTHHRFSFRVHPHNNSSLSVLSPTTSPTLNLHQLNRNRILTTSCVDEAINIYNNMDDGLTSDDKIAGTFGDRSIQIAAWIGVATVASKILGLLREITMAATFGVGPVATAFKYASVLPGFFASLLGGVNGPIHITMATTLSKLSEERRRRLFKHTNAAMFLVGGVLGILVFVSAKFIIHLYAPGLWILTEGQFLREMASAQLKMMIPCVVLAGPVGLGFGYMSAERNNILPSISPALSSMLMIAFCFMYAFMRQFNVFQSGDELSGGMLISFGASLGVFLQWIIQVIVLRRRHCNMITVSWTDILKDRDVHEFFLLLLPATISSGLAQVASFTDLCFASMIPGAAAGLSYAYLLVMAPLSLLSSMVVLPLLPTLSKLSKTLSWPSLTENIKLAVLLCMVLILPVLSIMCVLAKRIIRVLFERHAFDSAASSLVSSLFICYSIGSPFYIVRELLVAVFYALGDGQRPFLVSLGAITLNAILDWLFVSRFYLGAQGLALSTSFTTALSVLILSYLLQKKLPELVDYAALAFPLLLLSFCCFVSGFTTSVTYNTTNNLLSSIFIGRFSRIQEILSICLGGFLGIIGFFFPLILLHLSGFKPVRDLGRRLMNRQ